MVVRVRTGADVPVGHGVRAHPLEPRVCVRRARRRASTNPVVDPISGEPEFKHTPVSIEHFAADWYGVMLTRAPLPPPDTRLVDEGAGRAVRALRARRRSIPRTGRIEARRLLGVPSAEVADRRRLDRISRSRRGACIAPPGSWTTGSQGCIYIDRRPALPERAWLAKLFTLAKLDAARCAPACSPAAQLEGADQGALVCSCFGVGRNPIAACARELGAAATPVEIGKRLKCGTNCGSCIPEIQAIIGEVAKKSA